MTQRRISYFEASARSRIEALVDTNSFTEYCPAELRFTSPHLAQLDAPVAFDDGVVVGHALLDGRSILLAAQEGKFNGGSVGEVHGAKIRGLLERALQDKPQAVLLLVDSGGVRLHEANAGLIAISEIMRAVLNVQAAGIPVLALVGGSCGAFGGMGITTRLCNEVIMSEEGRLALSGPEVIETVKGVGEFDSKDRALVWRITGGKIRRTLKEATVLVDDNVASFRAAALSCISGTINSVNDLDSLVADQAILEARYAQFHGVRDGLEIWQKLGFSDPQGISLLETAAFNAQLTALER